MAISHGLVGVGGAITGAAAVEGFHYLKGIVGEPGVVRGSGAPLQMRGRGGGGGMPFFGRCFKWT